MAGYSAPPQAYTRDTLVKAIDWIAHQPEQMRSQATNADTLVAFYLQSKRRTTTSSTHPVSGETFTEDLKNLAKDLEQFTSHQHSPQAQPTLPLMNPAPPQPTYYAQMSQQSSSTQTVSSQPHSSHIAPMPGAPLPGAPPQQAYYQSAAQPIPPAPPQATVAPPPQHASHFQEERPVEQHRPAARAQDARTVESRPLRHRTHSANHHGHEGTSVPQWTVDAKSWAAATALKERLNLSSEAEALRMMVSLGAERLSDLIP